MNDRYANQPEDAVELNHIPPEAASQGQSAQLKWGFVFHKLNSTTGNFYNISTNISDSLGALMKRAKRQDQEFLPKSWLRRFISKAVVERATIDYSPAYDLESQNFPVRVKSNTIVNDSQLTEAFYNPQNFYNVSVQNANLVIFSSPTQNTPSSQTVVSLRTVLNKKRIFWLFVTVVLAVLLLVGIAAGIASKNMGTAFLAVGALMGLFSLAVGVAAILWKT